MERDLEDLIMEDKFMGVYNNEIEQKKIANTERYYGKLEGIEEGKEETQQEILSQFKSVNASEEEMDLFRTSTFMIAASVFDEHIKKAEKSYEKDQNTAQLISNSYGFDIYSEEGKVDKYLLFVAMLIDGCSETNEKNIYNRLVVGISIRHNCILRF